MNAIASVVEKRDAVHSCEECELEDHVEEVRSRNEQLRRLLNNEQPFEGYVLELVYLEVEAVRELLDHCQGLHHPDLLVRALAC